MKNSLGDHIIDKIGGHGRYQILLVTCLFFLGIGSDFYYFYVPLMETPPIVTYLTASGESRTEPIDYNICEGKNYTILEDQSKDTIFKEYAVYCDKWQVSIFGAALCLGSIIGTILLTFLQKLGTKACVVISACMFIFTTPLVFIQNFYLQVIANVIFGFANDTLFMLRNTIVTEITDGKYRSYFMNASISTGCLCSIIYYYIFSQNVHYRYVYILNAVFLSITLIIMMMFTVENPRYFLMKIQNNKNDFKSKEKLRKSINFISQINKSKIGDSDKEELISLACAENILEDIIPSEENSESVNLEKEDSTINLLVKNSLSEINKKSTSSAKTKLFSITFVFFCFFFMIIAFAFELKQNSNYLNSYFYLINILMLISYYIISMLMNVSYIGRRFSIIICIGLLIILKVLKLIFETSSGSSVNISVLLFLTIRLLLYTGQIPMHTLITESFNTKDRINSYSFMYIFANVVSLIGPFFVEYLSREIYDYSIIGICLSIIIVILLFIKETLNSKLED